MKAKTKLRKLRKTLRRIANYPPKGNARRDKDGYPTEFTYDEFAYKRVIDSFRDAIREALKDS